MLLVRRVFVVEWHLSQKNLKEVAVLEHQCKDGIVHNNEQWKDVKGYEGKYQISSIGRVKSLARMRNGKSGCKVPVPELIMALTPKKETARTKPYLEVKFRDGGLRTEPCKSFLVHRLVAAAFIRPLEPKEQVDHINGIHGDNRVENLRIMSYQEHGRIHPNFASKEAKEKLQNLAQEKLQQLRKDGWKAPIYTRTESHINNLRQNALNNPRARNVGNGQFVKKVKESA